MNKRRYKRACFYCKSVKKRCITHINENNNHNNKCKRCFKKNITCIKKCFTAINFLDEICMLINELTKLKNFIYKNIGN